MTAGQHHAGQIFLFLILLSEMTSDAHVGGQFTGQVPLRQRNII